MMRHCSQPHGNTGGPPPADVLVPQRPAHEKLPADAMISHARNTEHRVPRMPLPAPVPLLWTVLREDRPTCRRCCARELRERRLGGARKSQSETA